MRLRLIDFSTCHDIMIIASISANRDLYRCLNLIMSFGLKGLLINSEKSYVFPIIFKEDDFVVMFVFVVLAKVEVGG